MRLLFLVFPVAYFYAARLRIRALATMFLFDTQKPAWKSDLRFSHVDIVVDDLQGFLFKWCGRSSLGFVHSQIQTWRGPKEPTWSEYAFVFNAHDGELMLMVVQGKKHRGVHVDLLRKYGSGSIYRLCFKTDDLEATFDHLKAQGKKVTDLEGQEFRTFQHVKDSGKQILWLEKDGELSMEILTAPIIDDACERLQMEIGFFQPPNRSLQGSDTRWKLGVGLAAGTVFLSGFLLGSRTSKKT